MTSLPLTLSLAPLPTGQWLDANQYAQAIIANLNATLTGNILLGQTGGQKPITDVGPWFDGTQWWFWDSDANAYLPSPLSGTVYNVVDNASMTIMQRIAPISPLVNGTYILDRYKYSQNLVAGKVSASQTTRNYLAGTDYPHTKYVLSATCTVAEPALGISEYSYISQFIPVSRFRSMMDKPTSFSIVVSSNMTGTFYVALRNMDQTWTYPMPCVITSTNAPHRFSFNNIPAFPSISGNWGTTEASFAYEIVFVLSAGLNFSQGLANTWNSTNQICGSAQTNFFSAINNQIEFTLLQHQPGQTVSPFIFKNFADDLWSCQEFFCKSYDYAVAPGTANAGGGLIMHACSATSMQGIARFPRRMRAVPTMTVYAGQSGTIGNVTDTIAGVNRAISAVQGIGESGFWAMATAAVNAAGSGYSGAVQFHYLADADA